MASPPRCFTVTFRASAERLISDVAEQGELEAWSNRLEFYGIPTEPPANWQPDDPEVLMLPEERGRGD